MSNAWRWKRKSKIVDGHWIYPTNHKDGYPRVRFNGKKIEINRVSAHLFLGLDLNDSTSFALHKTSCPYHNCWNPKCLYIGNQKDNVRDARIIGTFRPWGH